MPRRAQYEGTPLVFCRRENQAQCNVRAYINDPSPSDAMLCFALEVNFFSNDANRLAYANCHLEMTQRLDRSALVGGWVASYVL